MPSEKKKLPSVLLLFLSSLGIFIGLLAAAAVIWAGSGISAIPISSSESLTLLSVGTLAFLTSLLNVPTLVFALKDLRGKDVTIKQSSLFRSATIALAAWSGFLVLGTLVNRSGKDQFMLAPITILAIAIPLWWLVEFGRRGLARTSALREWGTLTLGLTISPLIIIIVEVLVVVLVTVFVAISISFQPDVMNQITAIMQSLEISQGGLEELEKLMFQFMQNPLITAAIFLVIGIIAPFIEELFKPLAVWFLLRRPIKPQEGFVLGLISGGAFALLESAGLVSQVVTQEWAITIGLRSATGLLHIGLSGLVGFGIASAWNEKRKGRALLYLLAAAALHGLWNSAALLGGYSTTILPSAGSSPYFTPGNVISVAGMLVIFIAVLSITIRLNQRLVHEQNSVINQTENI